MKSNAIKNGIHENNLNFFPFFCKFSGKNCFLIVLWDMSSFGVFENGHIVGFGAPFRDGFEKTFNCSKNSVWL